MLSIKQKLRSKRGASMVMAMVFLMFCTLIGSSVLAAATANASRIEHLTKDQQAYYSQRSAAMLMAKMLTAEDGKELQVMITDVILEKKDADPVHTITFTSPSVTVAPGNTTLSANFLQQLLFEVVVSNYPSSGADADYTYFDWIAGDSYAFAPISGTIEIEDGLTPEGQEELTANFSIDIGEDYDVRIDFGADSYTILTMDGSIGRGRPKVVTMGDTTTTTTTTIIRWSMPDIAKGGT